MAMTWCRPRASGRCGGWTSFSRAPGSTVGCIGSCRTFGSISGGHARSARMEPTDLEALAVGDAEREMNSRLVLTSVQQTVAVLPEEQRTILLLVCVEGLSYKAVAEALEIPLGTVMSRLARARLAIGRALEGEPISAASQAKG